MQLGKICKADPCQCCGEAKSNRALKMNDYEKRLGRVIHYIQSNPAGDLSLDALADVAAMSRFHWHRVWRAMTGETAAQTVRRIRLHRASHTLLTTALPVAAVAREVGYPNPTSFSRAFTDHYGLSPAAYRQRGEALPPIPHFSRGDLVMPDVEIRNEPARRIAAIAHHGPYMEVSRSFEKLGEVLGQRGLYGHVGRLIGVYYDDPGAVPQDRLRSHAGIETDAAMPIEAPLEEVTLPGGRHAVLRHRGSYSGLPAAYDQLYAAWLPQSGEEPADSPPFELYQNTPMDVAEADLVTDICVPLK